MANIMRLGGGSGGGFGGGLNIAYGTTPPADTSKLWVPLTKKPANVEISGDSLQNAVDTASLLSVSLVAKGLRVPTAEVEGKIYAFSTTASSFDNYYMLVQEIDPVANTCVVKNGLAGTGHYPQGGRAVSVLGKIYVFGSQYTDNYTKISEYDPVTDTAVLKNATFQSYKAAITVIDEKVYSFGYYNISSSDPIYEYDPVTDTATKIGSLPVPLKDACATTIRGKAYIFGGLKGSTGTVTNAIYEFDPTTNSIKEMGATLPTYVTEGSAVTINDKAYIIGGHYNTAYHQTVYEYDPVTDTCTLMGATLPATAVGSGSCVIGDTAYIIGGIRDDSQYAIQTYTPKAYLDANHLKVFASVYKNGAHQVATNIVNGKNAQITLHMTSAFLGDEEGYAKAQDAYVYDEANSEWQALDGTSMTTDMLNALAELGVT